MVSGVWPRAPIGLGPASRPGRALLSIAATLALGSCGTDTRVPPRALNNTATLSLVSAADVNRTPAGSPQRIVLTWWRLAQVRVVSDSLALFTPRAQAQLKKAGYASLLVNYLGPGLRTGRPQVQRVEYPGRRHALVFLRLTFRQPVSLDLFHEYVEPLALPLDRTRGGWRLSDPSWMIEHAKTVLLGRSQPSTTRTGRR